MLIIKLIRIGTKTSQIRHPGFAAAKEESVYPASSGFIWFLSVDWRLEI